MKKNLLPLLLLPLLVSCGETSNSNSTKPADASNTAKTTEKQNTTVTPSDTTVNSTAAPTSSSTPTEEPGTLVLEAEFSPDIEWAEDYPGFSGSQSGANIIVPDRTGDFQASNGFYVSYLYKCGATIGLSITSY